MKIKPTIIIAEAGVNHDGKLNQAYELVDLASKSGANIVKFQMFKSEKLVSRTASKASYQKNFKIKETQFEMLKRLELKDEEFYLLKDYCDKTGIEFMCSGFDNQSVDQIKKLNVSFFKIPSGEINNLPYLRNIGKFNKKIIISTGVASIKEIHLALDVLIKAGTKKNKITLLHCSSEYPAPFKDLNLSAIKTLKETFEVNVGYSDHSIGIEASIAAVALGANIIEKHFTISKDYPGPDHRSSIEPKELTQLVNSIRNIELALGDGVKKPKKSELKNKVHIRKSIFASKNILKGEIFSEKNLTVKRPGYGISPMDWDMIVGKKAKRNFLEDEMIVL